jgi:hypothetical protein
VVQTLIYGSWPAFVGLCLMDKSQICVVTFFSAPDHGNVPEECPHYLTSLIVQYEVPIPNLCVVALIPNLCSTSYPVQRTENRERRGAESPREEGVEGITKSISSSCCSMMMMHDDDSLELREWTKMSSGRPNGTRGLLKVVTPEVSVGATDSLHPLNEPSPGPMRTPAKRTFPKDNH